MKSESERPGPGTVDVLVIGAGIAGLSCAGALGESGPNVHVLEKSRGVGGRCATRRIDGQPVDHGLAFYHGDDPGFLSALHSVETESALRWPRRVAGEGAPCQPRAFRADQHAVAYASGVNAFAKHLAAGLSVQRETRATRLEQDGDRLAVIADSGRRHRARSIVLALPPGQALELLRTFEAGRSSDLEAAIALLAGVSMVRCLTVMAGYPESIAQPDWDVCYPRPSDILQMVSHDSTKRQAPARPVFVFQGRPRWSAEHWNVPPAEWAREMLDAAVPWCGDGITRPAWVDTQRWRHARLTGGDALATPLWLRVENGCGIGIAGEAMAEGGGVQAAWQSGRRMARRLLEDGLG